MTEAPNALISMILSALVHKPLLSETQANLFKNVRQELIDEGIRVTNLKKELDAAIDIGKSLGILTVQDENIKMPFTLSRGTAAIDASARSKSAPESNQKREKPDSSGKMKKSNYTYSSDEDFRSRSRDRVRSRSGNSRKSKRDVRGRTRRR